MLCVQGEINLKKLPQEENRRNFSHSFAHSAKRRSAEAERGFIAHSKGTGVLCPGNVSSTASIVMVVKEGNTNDINPEVNLATTGISFPLASLAKEMVNIFRMDATVMKIESSVNRRPGHILSYNVMSTTVNYLRVRKYDRTVFQNQMQCCLGQGHQPRGTAPV